MTQESKYVQSSSSFDKYLYKMRSTGDNKYTHTRIGNRDNQIYGGTYNIENMDEFYKKYYEYVFKKGNKEYLTERQLIEDGPLLIDVDLKFNYLATRVAILIKRSYIYKYKRLVTSRVYISLGMASAAKIQSLATTLEWPVLVGYLGYFLRVLTNLTSYT